MTLADWLKAIYVLALAGLSVYGGLGLYTLWQFWRHRHDAIPTPQVPAEALPPVTVQLPLFNERYVVDRLLAAAVNLRYPPGRVQIQVLDDSTDDTTRRAAALVERYRAQGVNISLLHRDQRQGYKAGALAAALAQADGEFIAIFDADFQPAPDFLLKTMPHFVGNPDLGVIQARWGHLNDDTSPLTAAQALALDKHFAVEQTVRHRADLFPKFNGTAGVWRRGCLEDAGGWKADTVCEDLCLSTRAVLRGWRFRFLPDVVAPAELPTSIAAYKNQQARWAKGSTQCLLKFGRDILADGQHSVAARLYALLTMAGYATSFLLLVLVLLQVPLLALDVGFSSRLTLFSIAGLGQPLLFFLGQHLLYPNWVRRLRHFPTLFLVAIGLSVTNARAVLQAIVGRGHTFVRTPKSGRANGHGDPRPRPGGYRLPFDGAVFIEVGLALYAGVGIWLALIHNNVGSLFLPLAALLGFGYVAFLSIRDAVSPRLATKLKKFNRA